MTPLPAGLLLFDTGIYLRFSRGEKYTWLGQGALGLLVRRTSPKMSSQPAESRLTA